MTSLAQASDFQKDFLPGYTGHVPSKNERFGATTGNRIDLPCVRLRNGAQPKSIQTSMVHCLASKPPPI